MFYRLTKLQGYPIDAVDGTIGSVEDVYFDAEGWGVRYFVVRSGDWLREREVLISPRAIRPGAWSDEAILTNLTREQIEKSPPVANGHPVSRYYEMAHGAHYRDDHYRNDPPSRVGGSFGMLLGTAQLRPGNEGSQLEAIAEREIEAAERSHLHSGAEVVGYDIEAMNGTIGIVEDFLIDDENWHVGYLLVDKRPWVGSGHVLIPVEALDRIDWGEGRVRLTMTRDEVARSAGYP
ncbi:PRC-barrel domain-containing protein [Aromatoleum aromaticum]|uniref:PRC-barrel domain-containing protein n=1 Tax=Aromatoleum aromaticum TaxID=551760 RepID=UPI0014598547|nr:PRC-barrel domain-containing protein [Aromatoleum aromaticum]NMG54302.1 hypothetical protein [Aromatoleum aromaticum]